MRRIVGIVLLVVGLILLFFGINAADSVADRMSEFFTGRFTDKTVWYLVLGAASAVSGLVLVLVGGRGDRV